ncbi:GPI transamidase component GPI16 [Teratosphaeria nubilosa]|uniref:GPI transamidase component GPI16 n=1 Tax=Teratosphaeria nubilosa TaxID=161662 RepID=A0A6G1L376_9PEZI|nr:GPI transamidase component GPI16 [Teratosphaeria nubilosa]
MRLSPLLLLPAAAVSAVWAAASPEYHEHLHLRPLPGGVLYAGFDFTATTSLRDYHAQHFRLFPRSLAQILQHSHTSELHLRFASGRWDEQRWGSRPRHGRREGGTGVELWAWLDRDGGAAEVERRWRGLVNSLSGLFCASLNFIDATTTTRPVLSFDPEGAVAFNATDLLHGTLPHEIVCTENLTPFLKLLPCKGKAGLSSLLDGHKVFDANWQTMTIDVRPVCSAGSECMLEIQQTLDVVLDIERSMRPRDSPIPRPPPIEEIECDLSKSYTAHDTCYPKPKQGEMAWSLSNIFGQSVQGSCRVGDSTLPDITLETRDERTVELVPGDTAKDISTSTSGLRSFLLTQDTHFNLSLPQQVISAQPDLPQPPLYASRQLTGYGQERGGMHVTLTNPHPHPHRIVYLESLPWFLRPYMHTLSVSHGQIEKMYYTPAIDRERGTHLELLLEIPAASTVELSYDVEKAILRYTEYPPDANRGFDVAAAVIRVLPRDVDKDRQGNYLRTTTLLLPLPTPDFSMPYNVIILTSTVIALGFGCIFNLLVRRFVLVEEVPVSPLVVKVRAVVGSVRDVVRSWKKKGREGEVTDDRADGVVEAEGNVRKESFKDK